MEMLCVELGGLKRRVYFIIILNQLQFGMCAKSFIGWSIWGVDWLLVWYAVREIQQMFSRKLPGF